MHDKAHTVDRDRSHQYCNFMIMFTHLQKVINSDRYPSKLCYCQVTDFVSVHTSVLLHYFSKHMWMSCMFNLFVLAVVWLL